MAAQWEKQTTGFRFANFQDAWDALAGVTTASLDREVQDQAKTAVRDLMWPDAHAPREFRNATLFITAVKPLRRGE